VVTELGGVLYLVTLLRWLELPGGWDERGTFAAHLSGWAIVEALARGLLGPAHDRYASDPLWVELAALDGRAPGTPLGAALPRQATFRLPLAWLRRWAGQAPRWAAVEDGSRLWLLDEAAGYAVADVPRRRRAPHAAAAEVALFAREGIAVTWQRAASPLPPPLPPGVAAALSPSACWWLRRVLGFVHHLLARVLAEPDARAVGLAGTLLAARGHLLVSRTHLDLFMDLNQIKLAVRRAGLDCDPAWVPDLGRIVLFHFQ
jgi:hypothetical protein